MKTSIIIKREKEDIKRGSLIITFNNEVKEFIAIYGGVEGQYHIFFPLHSFNTQTGYYRGIKKRELITTKRFRMERFTNILKIEQGDSKKYENTLLLITDIDEKKLYYAFFERLGLIEGRKASITPIKMIADTTNIVGTQVWIDKERCYVCKTTIELSN